MARLYLKFSTLLCLFVVFLLIQPVEAVHGQYQYKLVFSDNFSGKRLNPKAWSKIKRQPYPWAAYMSENEKLYNLKNGRLRLYALHNDGIEPSDTAQYLTGGISTQGKVLIEYGKIEVKARFKGAVGSWPAIWTLAAKPVPINDEQYAEIDLVEYLNRDKLVHHTAHNHHTIVEGQKNTPPYTTTHDIKFEKYNIYTLEILPTKLVFSINGKVTFVYPQVKDYGKKQFPYGAPSYLMLDMQVGGASWVSKPVSSTYPAYMDIDWVKIYELKQ